MKKNSQALLAVKAAIIEMRGLSLVLAGMVTGHLAPNSVVIVPHGTTIVSSDDVVGNVSSDSVQIVQMSTVKKGHRTVNKRSA